MAKLCIFCQLSPAQIMAANELAVATADRYPVSPGHTLIIPRRHFPDLSEATTDELVAMFTLLQTVRNILIDQYKPDGFNFGINGGRAAGQTVMHLHLHVIPRKFGDVPNPRGGIRNIMPNLTPYPVEFINQGQPWEAFLDHIRPTFLQPMFRLLDQHLLGLGIDVKRRIDPGKIVYFADSRAFAAIIPEADGLKIGWLIPDAIPGVAGDKMTVGWEWGHLTNSSSVQDLLDLIESFRQARHLALTRPAHTGGMITRFDPFPD